MGDDGYKAGEVNVQEGVPIDSIGGLKGRETGTLL